MALLSKCKICLLSFEDSERQVQMGDDVDETFKTLSFKLLSIGFFQGGVDSEVPCHLCPWCAARVEDAYDLQQRCIEASKVYKQKKKRTVGPVKDSNTVETLPEEVTSLTTNILPGLIRISKVGSYNAKTVSHIMAGAHDMFVSVRNLSSSLKQNATLLASAVQFTETTLSFIIVFLSMNKVSSTMEKSAEAIMEEAKMWKTKSAMLSDAASFVECVSPMKVKSPRERPPPKNMQKIVEKLAQIGEDLQQRSKDLQEVEENLEPDTEDRNQAAEDLPPDSEDIQNPQPNPENLLQSPENLQQNPEDLQKCRENLQQNPEDLQKCRENLQQSTKGLQQNAEGLRQDSEAEDVQQSHENSQDLCKKTNDLQRGEEVLHEDITTVPCDQGTSTQVSIPDNFEIATDLSLARPHEPGVSESEDITELATLEEQSLRRSLRNRSMVDTLVYWPNFKKQVACDKLPTPSSKPCSSPTLTSTQALDRLLLRRDVDSESDTGSNEKWAIVHKRKSSLQLESRKRRSGDQIGSDVSLPATDCASVENQCESTQEGTEKNRIRRGKIQHIDKLKTIPRSSNVKTEAVSSDNQNISGDVDQQGLDKNFVESNGKAETNSSLKVKLFSPRTRTCNICGKTLKCTRNLRAHMNMHTGSSPYQCSFCPKLFTSSWNRIQHERVHTGITPYKCDLCKESFRYNVSLRHHKLKAHDGM
ncbi:zinc finger protein sens-like [Thrips palmi]|uniref:Zinc finger protein sens-like n=1 Tax=Thrips palmi TaxID=161013 RepID=A0A6P8ZBY4_THRPL|nr:zinc finger protein sens-like [Thrips palmi]